MLGLRRHRETGGTDQRGGNGKFSSDNGPPSGPITVQISQLLLSPASLKGLAADAGIFCRNDGKV